MKVNLAEAAVVVAHVVANDNRKADDLTDKVWQTALDDIDLPEALGAVQAHYRESTGWLMPADVRRRVKAIRKERIDLAGQPDLPSDLDQIEERRWAREWRQAVASGLSREEATSRVDRAAGIVREVERTRPVAQLIAGSGFGKSVAS